MTTPISAPIRTRPRRGQEGFTLLEAIVAISILVGITAALFIIFNNSARLQEAVKKESEYTAMGRIAMGRIEREVSLAFLSSARAARPGGSGDNADETFTTIFVGEDADPMDKLNFTTKSHHKLYKDAKECSLTEIGYYEESDEESRYYALMHREEDRIDGEATEGGEVMILARSVKELNFRYFDAEKNEWLDEWDTAGQDQLNRLPRAVEVTLIIADEEGDERTWISKVLLKGQHA